MDKNYIIVHYGEIGLKGRNRPYFEKKLVRNLKRSLKGQEVEFFRRIFGRILIKLGKRADFDSLRPLVGKVFGIAYFALASLSEQDVSDIKKSSLKIVKEEKFKTFRVEASRSKKDFPLTSQEINEQVGAGILENIEGIEVNLEKPDLTIYIEIVDRYAFIYTEKIKGLGGLPVSVSGKVVTLLSSGFDSPLASFRMMRRGAKVLFVHFHAYPQTSKESIKNVEEIVKILNQYQYSSKIYLVPFLDIQREIVKEAYVADRVILYRRMMMRIAEKVAAKEGAYALVTGESLAQVASQTLVNLNVIDKVADMPIFRPLIGMDKEEVINEAKKVGTYEVSSRPYEDCCSLFVPKSPTTRANISEIKKQESKLDINSLVKQALESVEVREIK
jgi:thiamine biosynthesis protein ThiI